AAVRLAETTEGGPLVVPLSWPLENRTKLHVEPPLLADNSGYGRCSYRLRNGTTPGHADRARRHLAWGADDDAVGRELERAEVRQSRAATDRLQLRRRGPRHDLQFCIRAPDDRAAGPPEHAQDRRPRPRSRTRLLVAGHEELRRSRRNDRGGLSGRIRCVV